MIPAADPSALFHSSAGGLAATSFKLWSLAMWTYSEQCQLAENEIAVQLDELGKFESLAHCASYAFDNAEFIVLQRASDDTAGIVSSCTFLDTYIRSLKPNLNLISQWPNDPQAFGMYQAAGDSALHVAMLFSNSVNNAVKIAKHTAFEMESIDEFDLSGLAKWKEEIRSELEVCLDLTSWPVAKFRGDCNLVQRRLRLELKQVLAPNNKVGADEDGPMTGYAWIHGGKTFNDMPPTAWKLCNYLWNCRNMSSGYTSALSEAMYADHARHVDSYIVGSHRKSANKFFENYKLPWEVKAPATHVQLLKKTSEK